MTPLHCRPPVSASPLAQDPDADTESAGVTLLKADLGGTVRTLTVSQATIGKLGQCLFSAFAYNAAGIAITAGLCTPHGRHSLCDDRSRRIGLIVRIRNCERASAQSAGTEAIDSFRYRSARHLFDTSLVGDRCRNNAWGSVRKPRAFSGQV